MSIVDELKRQDREERDRKIRTIPRYYRTIVADTTTEAYQEGGRPTYFCDACSATNLSTRESTVDRVNDQCVGILCHSCKILTRRYGRSVERLEDTAVKIGVRMEQLQDRVRVAQEKLDKAKIDSQEHIHKLKRVAVYLTKLSRTADTPDEIPPPEVGA